MFNDDKGQVCIHVNLVELTFYIEGEMVFLDFQFLSSGDQMWDLGVTILLNTNLGLDKSSLVSFLQCYYETFFKKLGQLEAKVPQETFETFTQR